MCVGRYLVQGVDVWLNTPRRGLEASGTSGMKAAFNGALNLSIRDGWWDEGFKPNLGWAIGEGEEYEDLKLQDDIESNALYDVLEQEIIPLFYKKSANGIPREWVRFMKESMKILCPEYSTNRMSFEYTDRFYLPADEEFANMSVEDFRLAKECALWKEKIRAHWSNVKILEVSQDRSNDFKVDDNYKVTVKVQLGSLSQNDVSVEIYFGEVNEKREVIEGEALILDFVAFTDGGSAVFSGKIPLKYSGRYGFSARIRPNHRKLLTRHEPSYITWE
jgi:starch phosphorylase